MVFEKSLESPTAKRSNQSVLKEISPECSLEGLMLNLKLQYFLATCCKELTYLKRHWCWERLKVGGEGDNRGWDGWIASPAQWNWVWVRSGSCWYTGKSGMLAWDCKQSDTTEQLNWTDDNTKISWLLKVYSISETLVESSKVFLIFLLIICLFRIFAILFGKCSSLCLDWVGLKDLYLA